MERELDTEGCKRLASAIIRSAIYDYRQEVYRQRRGIITMKALMKDREVFYSEWFKFLFLCLGFEADDENIDYYIEKIEGRK